jgi:hypothetical protein
MQKPAHYPFFVVSANETPKLSKRGSVSFHGCDWRTPNLLPEQQQLWTSGRHPYFTLCIAMAYLYKEAFFKYTDNSVPGSSTEELALEKYESKLNSDAFLRNSPMGFHQNNLSALKGKTHSGIRIVFLTGIYIYIYFLPWRNSSSGPRPPHCRGFMITLRHIAIGRTPLDEWPARRTDY